MAIVTRANWNARRPTGRVYTVPWSARTEFFVHHTNGPRNQKITTIQDFHLDIRGWSDVGYNWLVRDDGTIYEGRGWTAVGAHCPGHNRTGIGVAFIGNNNPTPEALKAIRWLYDEACRRAGRKLRKLGHGDRWATECPGSRLQAWVDAGMPIDGPLPTPQPPAASRTEKLMKDLPLIRPDDDNFDVKTVRANLFARGRVPAAVYATVGLEAWLNRTKADPEFVDVVCAFQRAEGLDDDGYVGPLTWPRLLRVA